MSGTLWHKGESTETGRVGPGSTGSIACVAASDSGPSSSACPADASPENVCPEGACREDRPLSAWRFGCVTFGCKVNQYETEAVREAWTRAGGVECERLDEADVLLVNSCAITARAERDARNALIRLGREAGGAVLVLTGCAARLVADFAPRKHAPVPKADLVVVQEKKEDLCREDVIKGLVAKARAKREGALSRSAKDARGQGVFAKNVDIAARSRNAGQAKEGGQAAPADAGLVDTGLADAGLLDKRFVPEPTHWKDFLPRPYPSLSIETFKRARPVLKVQDGCTHNCTYCIVPSTRGPNVSREPGEVVREAERLFENHAEIMLSGVNLGQYGKDNKAFGDFWDLLERLDRELAPRFAGKRRIRISSLEPSQLDERGCEILGRTTLVAPHLHISLQHASKNVLRRMARGHYGKETLWQAVDRLSTFWPVLGLGADILVGFPGETEADVEELCRFVEETPFTYAHVFPYSRRPGTQAANYPDQLEKKVKAGRAARVREVVAKKARAFWESRVGKDDLLLALDAGEGLAPAGLVHAVDAFYTPCFVEASAMGDDETGKGGFLRARATGVCGRGVLVEPLQAGS